MNSYKALEFQAISGLIFQVPLLMIHTMEILIFASVTFFMEDEIQIVYYFFFFFCMTVWICMLTLSLSVSEYFFLFHGLGHYTFFFHAFNTFKTKAFSVEVQRRDSSL